MVLYIWEEEEAIKIKGEKNNFSSLRVPLF